MKIKKLFKVPAAALILSALLFTPVNVYAADRAVEPARESGSIIVKDKAQTTCCDLCEYSGSY